MYRTTRAGHHRKETSRGGVQNRLARIVGGESLLKQMKRAAPRVSRIVLCAGVAVLAAFMTIVVTGGPFAVHASDGSFSYSLYDEVLKRFVDDRGMVDYRALKANRSELDRFVTMLGTHSKKTFEEGSEQEKIAFWINAYNALTLRAIIDNYPIKSSFLKSLRFPKNSIRQISGVWDKLLFTVMGDDMTLDDIEHQVLRKEFDEPRIHMALVCAAKGCPILRNEPYEGERLNAQLDDQSKRFVGDPTKFRIEQKADVVFLSSIFKWFGSDFITRYRAEGKFKGHDADVAAVLNFASRYVPEDASQYLARKRYAVKYLSYDWSLNEQSR